MKYIGLLISCLLLLSCKSLKNTNIVNTREISDVTVTRTPCFGMCPTYTLRISKDGEATLDAQKYLKNNLEGKYTAQISPKQLNGIYQMLHGMDFTALLDRYGSRNVTDLPSVNTVITYQGGLVKKINDYGNKGTPELVKFYTYMDKLLYGLNWKVSK